MLRKVKKALLLSDVASFADSFKMIAEEEGVELQVEKDWRDKYRVSADVIIAGAKYLSKLNDIYLKDTVLILKPDEEPEPYIKLGITHFIFNFRNRFELSFALYKTEAVMLHTTEKIADVIKDSEQSRFQFGDYDFKFDVNQFAYKGKTIYLSESAKQYLAEWLLYGHKENNKRAILCRMRKSFGNEFLSDINRFGELKGGKNEQ